MQQEFHLFIKIDPWRRTKFTASFLGALLVLALLLDWSFVRYRLLDESMAPVFWGGQKVITLRWAYLLHGPARNDLIIYSTSTGSFQPGKVIGLPGDKIEVVNGSLQVNSQPKPDSKLQPGIKQLQFTVPSKWICVIEPTPVDNPDSLKLIPCSTICGKILGQWQVLLI